MIKDVRCTEDVLQVDLIDGRSIAVPLAWYPRLLYATLEQRANWRICGGGFGIHWPDIDEDLCSEGLLRGEPAPRSKDKVAKPKPSYQLEKECELRKAIKEVLNAPKEECTDSLRRKAEEIVAQILKKSEKKVGIPSD
jgi:hypothetical protein